MNINLDPATIPQDDVVLIINTGEILEVRS